MIIFRYLAKEVYANVLGMTAILLALLTSNQFVQYLTQAAAGRLSIATVFALMSLQIPMLLGLMLPLGLYVGVLIAYGRFYADREMTVLHACGVSRGRLLVMTSCLALGVMLVVAVLTVWVQPRIEQYKHYLLQRAIQTASLAKLFPEQFQTLDDGKWVVYVNKLSHDHKHLEGLWVAERIPALGNIPMHWRLMTAASGEETVDRTTQQNLLILKNGYRTEGLPGDYAFKQMQFAQYQLYLSGFTGHVLPKMATLSLSALWALRHDNQRAMAELQWRLVLPFSVLLLGLIAASLSEVKPRQGRYAKLLPAVLIYIAYANLMFVSRAWLAKGATPAWLGLWWVDAVFFIAAVILMLRFTEWRPALLIKQLIKQRQGAH